MSICTSLLLVAHLWSVHDPAINNVNNDNYGSGVDCEVIDGFYVGVGRYYNSEYNYTNYILAQAYPIDLWGLEIGVGLGVGSGYENGYELAGGLLLATDIGSTRWSLQIAPSLESAFTVVHSTLSLRF